MTIAVIGLDLAKNVFQVHGIRRERSCGSQTEDTAIGGIAVIFQTSAGARWNGSMPYFALLGA